MKVFAGVSLVLAASLVTMTTPEAKAVSLEKLHLVAEQGLTVDELNQINTIGSVMGLHAGDYPNSLHAADYPDSLHAGDYPNSLHAADYPDSLHAGDYPNSRVELNGTGAEKPPMPVLDL